jgi:two-component system, cell cycle sensor histidine kinase and response regulator CckA
MHHLSTEPPPADRPPLDPIAALRVVFDDHPYGAYLLDEQGRLVYVNDCAVSSLGYTRDELLAMRVFDIDRQFTPERLKRYLAESGVRSRRALATWHTRKDGSTYPVEITTSAIRRGESVFVFALATDMTERLRAEQNYTLLFNGSNLGIMFLDASGRIVQVNPACLELFGHVPGDPDAMIGRDVLDLVHPDDRARFAGSFGRPDVETDTPAFRSAVERCRIKRSDGSQFLCEARMTGIPGVDGHAGIVSVFLSDVTALVRAQDRLRDSEARFRSIVESTPLGIHMYRIEADGGVVFEGANPAADRILGPSQEAIGKTMDDAFPDFAGNGALDGCRQVVATGNSWQTDRASTGTYDTARWLEIHAFRSIPGHAIVLFSDITQRRRMEDHLRQVDKMEAIGQLAGGVAHDFNNQLTGILGFAELLRGRLRHDDTLRQYSEAIFEAAKRSAQLTGQLLAFARKGKFQSAPVDLHRTVHDVIVLLERTIDKRIRIRTDLDASDAVVHGDPAQLQHALLNVAINARDAMPEGGVITFSTELSVLDDAFCRTNPCDVAPGRYWHLTISDTGHGMDGATVEHMFEPFFTTKPEGKGTGLGLAAVWGTVKNHKGAVGVRSEIGRGTSFSLYLPASTDTVRDSSPASAHRAPATTSGRVLLVDDEDVVLAVGAAVLGELGHGVTCARSGREAVDLLRADPTGYDAVLLDMMMPEMSGAETYRAMREIRGDLGVILSSGYSLNDEAQRLLDDGAVDFVVKPYERARLVRALGKVARRSAARA